MIKWKCVNCDSTVNRSFNINSNLSCQHCGSNLISLESKINILSLICAKCSESFAVESGSVLNCFHKCGSTTYEIRQSEKIDIKTKVKNFVIETKDSYKFVVPYYDGGLRIERAIQTWIRPNVVFAICDKGIIPPGSGICTQFYTSKTSKDLKIGHKNLPLLIETLKGLYELYPYEDYYGYFNSDIILPAGIHLSHLLPFNNKLIALHHRVELVGGSEGASIRNLKEDRVVVIGKDGFVFKRKILIDILENFPEMIIGIQAWDTALAVWLARKYGVDAIDLCYKEIKHYHHMTEETYKEREALPETEYNIKVYEELKGSRAISKDRFWGELTSKAEMERQGIERRFAKKEVKKIGIIQPRRLGDIIICLPIAKYYYDKGYEIYWPVEEKYLNTFDKIPYVKTLQIDKGKDSYTAAIKILVSYSNMKILDLGIGLGRDEKDWRSSGLHFDEWKYKEAKVPFKEKYNLQINRDYKKEEKLKEIVGAKNKQYIVTHSKSSFAEYNFAIPDAIEVEEIDGYDIFDWIGIINGADMVFTVDSSVLNLINQLGICKDRRYYIDWDKEIDRHGGNILMPIIEDDWQEYSYFEYNNKRYPSYINDNNARQHIDTLARKYCRGKGIDLGGGKNSFYKAENIDIKLGSKIEDINLKRNSLDYIFSSHFLEHLTEEEMIKVFQKSYTALKKDKYLFLYLPHPDNEYWHPNNPRMQGQYGHKQILYPIEVLKLLRNAGFTIVENTYDSDYYYSYYIVAKKESKKKKKIKGGIGFSFIMIVLNGMPIIKAALKSIEKYAHQIIIVEGALEQYKFIAGENGLSTDGTTEFLMKYSKEKSNVVYLQSNGYYTTKDQMHNIALEYVTGNYIWLIDSDELYIEKDILEIKKLLKEHPEIDQVNFEIINFFKSKKYIMDSNDEKFISASNNIRRIFKFKEGLKFIAHRPPQVNVTCQYTLEGKDNPVLIYHFSYCLRKQVRDKVKYYIQELRGHQRMSDWYHNFYIRWTEGNREELEGKEYGVWPADRFSKTIEYIGELPEAIKRIEF